MAKVPKQRIGQVSFARGGAGIKNNHDKIKSHNNNNKNNKDNKSKGKPHSHKAHRQQNGQKPNKNSGFSGDTKPAKSLENDLDSILHADTLAKHIDPPFTELEDDFSRLKTQTIQLATLVLHLQNRLESEQSRHKRTHPPEVIATGRSLPPDSSNGDKIKTTTVKVPRSKGGQKSANEPISIIYSSTPTKPRSAKRAPNKTAKVPQIPQTPGTADWAGSPMSIQMASPSATQLTPTLDRLLEELREAIQTRNGEQIALDLQIEAPLAQAYSDLAQELKAHYPWGKDQHLRTLCERILPVSSDGSEKLWDQFAGHLFQYLQFIRDFAPRNLLRNNVNLKRLLNTSCICLGDSAFGALILPTVLSISGALARLAVALDKRPDWVGQLLKEHNLDDEEGIQENVTFVEDAANTIREAFIKCLSDKSGSGGLGRNAAPEGKRTGIYKAGNLCLKLLFQCRKLSTATTMFVSIDAQSPLLSHYPASQRVTYLYYLGRYLFANNHFFRAQLALQAAYDQCHAQALGHRKLILVYLIASNICLGRFPSSKLMLRREAAELAEHFLPLCRSIASGDLSGFNQHLNLDNPHAQWLLRRRLLLQLRNRCEPLVWRCLARRVFIEVGFPGGEDNKTPFLRLHLLQAAAQWLDKSVPRPALQETAANPPTFWPSFPDKPPGQAATEQENGTRESYGSEFAGMEEAIAESGFDIETGTYTGSDEQQMEPLGRKGVAATYGKQESHPTIEEVESIMASLIQQDLIVGFLTHNNPRFAIPGAKQRGALAVGFPPVWEVIKARKRGSEVPGWVREDGAPNVFAGGSFGDFGGGGRVVNLSGARPVGARAA